VSREFFLPNFILTFRLRIDLLRPKLFPASRHSSKSTLKHEREETADSPGVIQLESKAAVSGISSPFLKAFASNSLAS